MKVRITKGKAYIVLGFLLCIIWVVPRQGMACGLCHEDDRSAVYSYEAVQKAKAQPDKLEFAVFKITGPLDGAIAQKLQNWLGGKKGIDASTIKISAAQKSMGLIMEKSVSKDSLIAELETNFPGLKFHSLIYN